MRNKLKRSRSLRGPAGSAGDCPPAADAIVVPDCSCPGEETSTAVGAERKRFRGEGARIAPIFLTHRSRSQRSSDGARVPPRTGDAVTEPPAPPQQREGPGWRAPLPASALQSCLQEVQTSSPDFPVRSVFSTLQKKAGVGLLEKRPADSCFEDELWTDKFSPRRSSEVLGNPASLTKVHSWLKKWKLRADGEERRKMEETKREENSNDSWDCGDFQGEVRWENKAEEPPRRGMLITGPAGVGKTASVYACAQELGFKVFEVNCSSRRSGRSVLSQLTEATQSHLLEVPGQDPLKPAYFSSCTPAAEALPGKTAQLKKRRAGSSGRKLKAKPNAPTLAHFFKVKDKAALLHFAGVSSAKNADRKEPVNCDQTGPQSRKTATSLILFEEVDVVFEDDVGFLAAIKAFMRTTKRPVVLTTSDPSFKDRFDCDLEEVVFKAPSAASVCSYLQLVCLAEGVRLHPGDAGELFRLARGDVRRCLLQLQLWVCGGGGIGGFPEEPQELPSRQSGCSASMLGLRPVTPNCLLNFLKRQSWSETEMDELTGLLAGSWRAGVPLLHSNLELLLGLGAGESSDHRQDEATDSWLQSGPRRSHHDLHVQQKNQNIRPQDLVTSGESVRSISRLSRRKFVTAASDSKPPSSLTDKPRGTSFAVNGTLLRAPTEHKAEEVATDCLGALADFFDIVSYLDATLTDAGRLVPEAFIWTGAASKDGLLDEKSEEDGGSWSYERLLDVRAAVEGLGCHILWGRVSEAWTRAQKCAKEMDCKQWRKLEDRLFISSSGRQSLSLTFQPPCAPSVSQRRYKLSRTVLSSEVFSLLGNRRAVFVDYVPVLRSVCRSLSAQQQKGEPVRCVNYLSGLSKSTMKLLAEDFPSRKLQKDS